ncbi:MAG: M48 family metalloprotease [Chloroflexota bacterium]|nr:M48 family metalloprotease [Chloroflexota bacterium]
MNNFKTAILLATISGLLVVIGGAVGGIQGSLLFLILALALNVGSYWKSADLVLKASRAHEVSVEEEPKLHEMISEISELAGMPKPRVYLMNSPQPNAFATGRNPENAAVAVTDGIRELLTERELRAVISHEMAHVSNRDILISTIAASVASAISWIGFIGFWFGGSRNNGGNIVALLLAPLLAGMIQMAISRSREYEADADGAEFVGDPLALATALQKIEMGAQRIPMKVPETTAHLFIMNPFLGMNTRSMFSTHPKTEDRVARLTKMAASLEETKPGAKDMNSVYQKKRKEYGNQSKSRVKGRLDSDESPLARRARERTEREQSPN